MPRLYLDNAATSFPKPPAVLDAMDRFARTNGASPRGRFAEARDAARFIHQCRERFCKLVNGECPDHVIFTLNTTDALNLAIRGLVDHRRLTEPGRPIHLITTWLDHNSILRVLNSLAVEGVRQTRVEVDPARGAVDPADIQRAITPDTLLVAVNHASNVTGAIQPIADVGAICRRAGVPFLVDGAQSLGHIPVDVRAAAIDLLAFPGHKGLLGPTGTGGLYIRPGIEHILRPVRQGGTGSRSEEDTQPTTLPDRYEPGSPNTVGIIGLSEALAWLLDRGIDRIAAHERRLRAIIEHACHTGRFPGLRLLGADLPHRVGVFSFVHDSLSATTIADQLESRGILTRPGLHCAPLAHRMEHTGSGATRLSLGPFLTESDVAFACDALASVCNSVTPSQREGAGGWVRSAPEPQPSL